MHINGVNVDISSYACSSVAIIGLSSHWLAHFILLNNLQRSLYSMSIHCNNNLETSIEWQCILFLCNECYSCLF